jgi:putative transposase
MARPSRRQILGDGGATVHLVSRLHNCDFLLVEEEVKATLYLLLFYYKTVYGVLVHHYCFMDNHLHLILHAASTEALSRFMQQVFSQLAREINRRYARRGQVLMDRARTPVIQDGLRFITTMRYLDLNPVRAGLVLKAKDYSWNSYRYYAYGEHDDLIDPAPEYLGLSAVAPERRKKYQGLVNVLLGQGRGRMPELSTWYFIGEPGWVIGMLRRAGFMRPRSPPDGLLAESG